VARRRAVRRATDSAAGGHRTRARGVSGARPCANRVGRSRLIVGAVRPFVPPKCAGAIASHEDECTSANRRLSSTSRNARTTDKGPTASAERTILGLTRSVASQKELPSHRSEHPGGSAARPPGPSRVPAVVARHHPARESNSSGSGAAVPAVGPSVLSE
jgi:hypothetical protein